MSHGVGSSRTDGTQWGRILFSPVPPHPDSGPIYNLYFITKASLIFLKSFLSHFNESAQRTEFII